MSLYRRTILMTVGVAALTTLSGCNMLSARFKAREGADLYKAQNFAGASQKFEEASQLDPGLAVLLLNMGTSSLAHFRQAGSKSPEGQQAATRAISAYERYLEKKPEDGRVKAALVQTFVETSRYDEAVSFFKPAVEKSPPDIEALGILATVASKCNKQEETIKWHEKRIAAQPTKAENYVALGVFLWQEIHDHADWPHEKRKAKGDIALEKLKKAIDLAPNAPNAYTYTNLVYREMAQTDPTEEGKKKNLEEANRYFKMAVDRQKAG